MRHYVDYAICVTMVAVLYFHLAVNSVADVI
jgi:hypothetical protein